MARVFGFLLLFALFIGQGEYGSALAAEEKKPEPAPEAEQDPEESGRFFPQILPFNVTEVDAEFTITNGITFTDEASGFDLHLGGRLFLDAAAYFEDKNTGLGDNFGIADARIEVEANLRDDWTFRVSIGVTQTGDSGVSLDFNMKDLWLRYKGYDPLDLTFGQHDEPFSLEQKTSSRRITFLRRALPNTLVPDSNLGASVRAFGDSWSAQAGLFGDDIVTYTDSDSNTSGIGLTGRVSTTPVRDDLRLFHVGGSFSARKTNSSRNNPRISARPEVTIADFRFVDTGEIEETEEIYVAGLETALVHGPYSLQAEYIGTRLDRDNGLRSLWFDGWYVFASWLVTGERRPYIHEIGNFGSIKPKSKYGAVELAARYSNIDLSSRDIRGGKERNATIGLNWYVHQQVRLMLNYIWVWADDEADGNGTLIGGDSPQIFTARLQLNF